jgi:hypothetical protein
MNDSLEVTPSPFNAQRNAHDAGIGDKFYMQFIPQTNIYLLLTLTGYNKVQSIDEQGLPPQTFLDKHDAMYDQYYTASYTGHVGRILHKWYSDEVIPLASALLQTNIINGNIAKNIMYTNGWRRPPTCKPPPKVHSGRGDTCKEGWVGITNMIEYEFSLNKLNKLNPHDNKDQFTFSVFGEGLDQSIKMDLDTCFRFIEFIDPPDEGGYSVNKNNKRTVDFGNRLITELEYYKILPGHVQLVTETLEATDIAIKFINYFKPRIGWMTGAYDLKKHLTTLKGLTFELYSVDRFPLAIPLATPADVKIGGGAHHKRTNKRNKRTNKRNKRNKRTNKRNKRTNKRKNTNKRNKRKIAVK